MFSSILFIFALTLTSVPSFSVAATFTGSVVSVLDGDTIEVLNGHHAERIRLSGIDCPEKAQAYGQLAKTDQLDARVLASFAEEGGGVPRFLSVFLTER